MRELRLIECNGQKLAIYVPESAWKPGLNFFSSDADFIQVGTWGYAKDTRLGPHIHNLAPRESTRTQEVIYLKTGKVRAHLFEEAGSIVEHVDLVAGDMLIVLSGGHGYEVLEDGTIALEVKNGPYPGPEKDRRKIPWHDTTARTKS